MRLLRQKYALCLAFLVSVSLPALAQNPRVINAALKEGPSVTLDTNVVVTLSMTSDGESSPLDSVQLGQDVTIDVVIQPAEEDLGETADMFLVTATKSQGFQMRNLSGEFVAWDLKAKTLVATSEGVTLEETTTVELFSGQLGVVDSFRIFLAFLVGENRFYFTPVAMKFDIVDASPTAREQAIELFASEISPDLVQTTCITCHVLGGAAELTAQHRFVFPSNDDHLTINFEQFESLHANTSADYILGKVSGSLTHEGGVVVPNGSVNYNNLETFLDLLDQAEEEL